jgi:hypothetical protein
MNSVKQFFVLAALVTAVFVNTATVEAANPFEIKGIYVDVTADNVTEARRQALREGQNKAFEALLKRLTLKADRDFLPWVEPANQAQYIRDFSISGEKTSAVRYLATLSYHFKEEAIRDLLKARGLSFAETISKPVLVLALYDDNGRLSLWDEPNPWSGAWSSLSFQNGLVPVVLPLGDLADISSLSAQQAADMDEAALQTMAQRYDVNTVVVARLVVASRNGNGEPTDVDLITTRLGEKGQDRNTSLGITRGAEESKDAFLKRIASSVSDGLEESWKRDNVLQFGVDGILPVNLLIDGLNEWIDVKKRLSNVAVVRRVELALLSRDTVQINLHFIGDLDQLIGSLRQVDLDLTVSGESWSLINLRQGRPQ